MTRERLTLQFHERDGGPRADGAVCARLQSEVRLPLTGLSGLLASVMFQPP